MIRWRSQTGKLAAHLPTARIVSAMLKSLLVDCRFSCTVLMGDVSIIYLKSEWVREDANRSKSVDFKSRAGISEQEQWREGRMDVWNFFAQKPPWKLKKVSMLCEFPGILIAAVCFSMQEDLIPSANTFRKQHCARNVSFNGAGSGAAEKTPPFYLWGCSSSEWLHEGSIITIIIIYRVLNNADRFMPADQLIALRSRTSQLALSVVNLRVSKSNMATCYHLYFTVNIWCGMTGPEWGYLYDNTVGFRYTQKRRHVSGTPEFAVFSSSNVRMSTFVKHGPRDTIPTIIWWKPCSGLIIKLQVLSA